jgi:hypothetical protein
MAGAGFRTFVAGEVLTAAQVNTYLMEQAVMTFADAAARDAAVTSPTEGMIAFLKDTNQLFSYDGTTWNAVVKQETVRFTASGTFTKASYPWATYAVITCVGPGGAGGGVKHSELQGEGSAGAGGASGSTSIKFTAVSALAASETVTVGTGGTGVVAADGNDGSGDTSFGTICVAGYGRGGDVMATIVGGTAGRDVDIATGGLTNTANDAGDILLGGQVGGSGACFESNNFTFGVYRCGFSGSGGSTMYGMGGAGYGFTTGSILGETGNAGQGYGSGGAGPLQLYAGTSVGDGAGGAGADGIVIIDLYS